MSNEKSKEQFIDSAYKKIEEYRKSGVIDDAQAQEMRNAANEEASKRYDMEDIYSYSSMEKEKNKNKDKDDSDESEFEGAIDFSSNSKSDDSKEENDKENSVVQENENIVDDNSEESIDEEQEENLDNTNKDRKTLKRTLAALGALGILGGAAFGISSCVRKQKQENDENDSKTVFDFDNATFDELMQSLSEDSPRRQFAESVYDTTEKLNGIAKDKTVFALEADKDAVLQFTYDEVAAASLVLNNYTEEELKDIFGMDEMNVQKVMSNYQSFASKMMIYSMNAKAPSGVSSLITDEGNRKWFEQVENSIVEFNKDVTNKNADKLIRTFAYFYQHGINGVDNIDNDEASLSGVKNLALNMVRGYYDANVEQEYSQYLVVSSTPGEFDDQYRTNKTSQVQKGEKLKFYLDEAEKGPCTISKVEQHLTSMSEKLIKSQEQQRSYEQLLLNNLVAKVLDAGDTDLANKIMNNQGIDGLENTFKSASEDSKKALEAYKVSMLALNENIPSYTQIKNAADRELGPYIEVKDDVLYNNRIRGVELIDALSYAPSISRSEWDSMSHEEQLEYARQNGTLTGKTTSTTETPVSYDSLTPSEKAEAKKQAEQIKRDTYEVSAGDETYKGNKAAAFKKGWTDATNYAEENGAYSYHTIYNRINPDAVTAVPTNGTLSDIAQAAYAFEGKTITSGDSQIQARLNSDVEQFKKTVSDQSLIDAYKSGWLNGIEQKLSSAISQGKITKSEAERLYNEALQAAESRNTTDLNTDTNELEENTNNSNSVVDDVAVVSEVPTVNDIDPNISTEIPSSDDGLEDIYDENYDGMDTRNDTVVESQGETELTNSEQDDYYSYVADLTLQALDDYYAQSENVNEEGSVLIKN